MWGVLDEAMKILADELMLKIDLKSLAPPVPAQFKNLFIVPYDEHGQLSTKKTILDLRPGAKIKIAPKEACNAGMLGTVIKQNETGDYLINLEGYKYCSVLGRWWVNEAIAGQLTQLPIINEAIKVVEVQQIQ